MATWRRTGLASMAIWQETLASQSLRFDDACSTQLRDPTQVKTNEPQTE